MAYQTSTNHYQNTKYIVDAIAGASPYATIQSAINAANTAAVPCTVFIRPGTYTENLTLYDGVNLEGGDNALVTIVGKHVPPDAGDITFTRIGFQSATNVMEKASAGTTVLRFTRCRFIIANGYACNLTAWTGDLRFRYCTEYSSSVTSAIIYNATGTSPVIISYCSLGAGTAKTMTVFGAARIESSRIICPSSFNGTATSAAYGGCFFDNMITIADTANLSLANSTISTGATTAITITSTTPMTLANVVIKTSHATAIAGTGTVNFAETTFVDSKGLAGTIVEGLAGVIKTGEIYANTVLRMDMTGFYSWAAAGPYYDSATLGTFKLLVGGTGYIRGKVITWAAQNITGMTSGATWYIYIDSNGTIGKTSARTDALFVDYIVLFQCLYDETTGTKVQYVVKENHPYNFQVGPSNYLHDTAGTVIENGSNGANIVAGSTGVKVSIAVQDTLNDNGLESTIYAQADVTWNKMYVDAAGKWARDGAASTDFAGRWNSAGTPTTLTGTANRKFCIYRLYVTKDDLQTVIPATTDLAPKYFAVLDTAAYDKQADCTTAIANGLPAIATGELAALELAQLGFIIFGRTAGAITLFTISKSTLRATISTGGGTSTAGLVTTSTTNFDGILSAADTNVQAALETIDDFGKNITDKCLVVGNGNGNPLGVIAVGGTGTILTGVAANDPTWTAATYPGTLAKGLLMVATAANVIDGLTGSTGTAGQLLVSGGAATEPTWTTNTYATTAAAGKIIVATAANTIGELTSTGTAGQMLTSGGAATVPTWTTATYPATLTKGDVLCATAANVVGVRAAGTTGQIMTAVTTDIPTWTTATYPASVNKGDVLVASADNVIGIVAGAATSGYILTANGANTAPTFQAAAGGGIGTLAGDSGTATGATVTIAGGTNITTAAGTATLTVNLDAALTGITSVTGANGCELRTGVTAADTLILAAYDVGTTSYTPFVTLAAHATDPTCDLAAGVTIGGAYIYRASGTDVAVADGGTGASTLTDHGVLIGNATSAVTATAEGATGVILTGVTGSVPTWTTSSYPSTLAKGLLMVATAANVINGLTGSTGTAGQILTSGGAATEPTWTTATYKGTVNKGDVLIASADNVVDIVVGATTSGHVLTANGANTVPTFQANAGGGIGTLTSDSGNATGATVTIAGGTNIGTTAGTATLTVNLDAALTGITSVTGANGCELRTGVTAADTLILAAYDVGTTSYTPLITLAAHATDPTCDLAAGVTIGGANIYRVGGTDVAVADGGTGASTLTDHGVLIGNATSAVTATAEGATGEILVGTSSNPPSWLATGAEGKVLTSHNGTALTWETPGGGATWLTKADAAANVTPATVNYSYTINHATPATLLEITLPATAAVGDRVEIIGNTAGLWKLIAASGDTIKMLGSTTAAGGYLLATVQYDCVEVVCTVADTTWVVCKSMGNLTIA
jgi:hypothetical protein